MQMFDFVLLQTFYLLLIIGTLPAPTWKCVLFSHNGVFKYNMHILVLWSAHTHNQGLQQWPSGVHVLRAINLPVLEFAAVSYEYVRASWYFGPIKDSLTIPVLLVED